VKKNGKWGFIDKVGFEIILCQYEKVLNFSEELAAVEINGKWGFINLNGNIVIPCRFDGASSFDGGYATVKNNSKIGIINRSGKEVIACECDNLNNFGSSTLAQGWRNGKFIFYNKKGVIVKEEK